MCNTKPAISTLLYHFFCRQRLRFELSTCGAAYKCFDILKMTLTLTHATPLDIIFHNIVLLLMLYITYLRYYLTAYILQYRNLRWRRECSSMNSIERNAKRKHKCLILGGPWHNSHISANGTKNFVDNNI